MSLAGDHEDVPAAGATDRLGDGLPAVHEKRGGASRFGDARLNVPKDRLGLFRARVVRCHDHVVGQVHRDAPHLRPLAPVAIAPASEDHEDATFGGMGQRARGLQDPLERPWLVRVVDEKREAERVRNSLHPSGDRGHGREPLGDLPRRKAERASDGRGGEQVCGVGQAQQGRHDLEVVLTREIPHAKHRPIGLGARAPLHVGRRFLAEREADRASQGQHLEQPPAIGIVHVHDRFAVRLQHPHQPRLRLEVILEVAMEIEMVSGEIQERDDVEGATGEPAEREGMRAALHHRGGAPVGHERREHRLQLGGLGRRAHGLDGISASAIDERSEESPLRVPLLEHPVDEERRRGLAARAGHTDHHEALRGIPRQTRGHEAGRRTRIVHLDIRHAQRLRRGRGPERRDRAASDGFAQKGAAVRVRPRKGGEERAFDRAS